MSAHHIAEVYAINPCRVQAEKEVMMDSARMLQQQLALKDLVIQAFIPPPEVQKVSSRPHLVGGLQRRILPVCRCSSTQGYSTWSSRL